ncbi:hypothetical protein DENSPDRAFT_435671 [Dentipellis sp. KUC8613]|nr:hypothetical protein DENSPDRAFT_435671 [Dentipellis sp. KUC8613]
MGIFNNEKSALATQLKDVEAQLKTVTAERDALKESAGSSTVVPQQASEELEKLRQEKAALEQALQDEKAKQPPAAAPAPDTTELDAKIASLTQERDQLLAEKTTWEKSAGSTASASTEVNAQWEAEKVELTKSRDEAVAQAKSVKEEADKAKEEARELRLATEKFQARLQEAQKSRQRQVDEQVKAALEKSASATAAPSEELVKKHAEELRNLESRLTAKHKTELEAAVAAAEAKVKAEASSTAPALSDDGKAAVEAAIAAREAELKAHHAKEVSDAIEQGRSEISMKLMLKDRVIVNTQNRIRALEQQIEQLKGGNPASPSTPTPAAKSTPASKPAAPAAAASSASAPGPSTAGARPRGGAPAHAGGLPRKPGEAGAAPAGAGAPAGRGRGRGTARGGLSIRGTANSGHAAAAAAGPSHAAGAGGVSIMGAAGKRAREESDTSAPDSLAKRLKPADGSGGAAGAGAASGGSKPVTLQRNRVGPS